MPEQLLSEHRVVNLRVLVSTKILCVKQHEDLLEPVCQGLSHLRSQQILHRGLPIRDVDR
jgi:hypothetical protein